MARTVMACVVMAYILTGYTVMACVVMAHVGMAYEVMVYVFMAPGERRDRAPLLLARHFHFLPVKQPGGPEC